jgi:hypothetical protein
MMTILKAGAALAVFAAIVAYGTQSNADDPFNGAVAPREADLFDAVAQDDAVANDELETLSGREAIELDPKELAQIAVPKNNNTSTNNGYELGEGASVDTGAADGFTNNNGGINTFMQNTGNHVNFQNNTVVQIIFE